ncbi:MAG: DUF4412 domain-containing protein [Acidobacteria bacterium]|nr:DUF4412 domain-containing protein [Acidobacteriota bacterium]
MNLRRAWTVIVLAVLVPGLTAAADVKIVKNRHTDAFTIMGHTQPAKDDQTVLWVGADRMRMESPENIIIVRLDQKKMYVVDPAGKEYNVIDLPMDLNKILPPGMGEQMLKMMEMTATVTPTDETKKIGKWETRRWNVTLSSKMVQMQQTSWVTKDVPLDLAKYRNMVDQVVSLQPGMASAVKEMAKIDGLPVEQDTVTEMAMAGGNKMTSHEEVVSIDKVEAPAGTYDPPAGATAKPFSFADLMRKKH